MRQLRCALFVTCFAFTAHNLFSVSAEESSYTDPLKNKADWPEENDWKLAIEINTKVACNFLQNRVCFKRNEEQVESLSSGDASVSSCQRECENALTVGLACGYDAAQKKCFKCPNGPNAYNTVNSANGNADAFAGVCREHHDFAYSSPNWDITASDFQGQESLAFHGSNKLYKPYVEEKVTHVKLTYTGGPPVIVAVYPERQGKYTLRELVTSPGGSIASEVANERTDNWRGKPVDSYISTGTSHKFCEHFGFNYLCAGGHDGGRSTGRDFAYERARVRIGSVAGASFPCGRLGRGAAFGVGLDARYNRASFRVSSGYLDGTVGTATVVWKPMKVWVAAKLDAVAAASPLPFVPFGSKNVQGTSLQTFQLKAEGHAPIVTEDGSTSRPGVMYTPRMSYTFYYKINRVPDNDFYDDVASKQVFKYGSTGAESLPEASLIGKQWHRHWSPNLGWDGSRANGRQLDYRFATNRRENGVLQDFDAWKRGDNRPREWQSSLTIGRFHHVGVVIDMNTLMLYVDGHVHAIYPLPPNTPGPNSDVYVQDLAFRFLNLASTDSNAGNEMHSFRYFPNVALSGIDIMASIIPVPHELCGNGVRSNNEECDDGNRVNGDGCSSLCMLELGYICRGGNTTSLAADFCSKGHRRVAITFDDEFYGVENINTSVYDVEKWSMDPTLPKLFDNIHAVGEHLTERRGVTVLTVDKDVGTVGKGLKLRFRNAWFTEEYHPSTSAKYSPVETLADASLPNTGNFLQNQKIATVTLSSLANHSFMQLQFSAFLTQWTKDTFVVVEIDGDAVFAHAANTDYASSPDQLAYTFRDTLKNGNEAGDVWAWSTNNPSVAAKSAGKSEKVEWKLDTEKRVEILVNVSVPHVKDSADITIRCIGVFASFRFSSLQYRTGSTSPNSPFRPYVWDQGRNGGDPVSNQRSMLTYTWFQLESPVKLMPTSWFSFDFRISTIAQYNRIWTVTLMDAASTLTPSSALCRSTAGCSSPSGCSACRPEIFFYRICYNPSRIVSAMPTTACDETHHPVLGVWHRETIPIFAKFSSRYSPTESSLPRRYRAQFSFLNIGDEVGSTDSEMEMHLDNIAFDEPAEYTGPTGCGSIEVTSNSSVTFALKGQNLAIPYRRFSSGFCFVFIKRYQQIDHSLTVECGSETDLVGNVTTAEYGDRLLVASYGEHVTCGTACIDALKKLGGSNIGWKDGSSLALLGKKGKPSGEVAMAYTYQGEGGANAKNILHCSDIKAKISEATNSLAPIGPPTAFLDAKTRSKARFVLNPASGGYLGCYRIPRSGDFRQGGPRALWFNKNVEGSAGQPCMGLGVITTPSTCAWCCGVHGFTLSGNNNYRPDGDTTSACFCGDSRKQVHAYSRLLETRCSTVCPFGLQTCGGNDWYYRAHAIFETTGEVYLEKTEVTASHSTVYDNSRDISHSISNAASVTLTFKPVLVSAVRISSSDTNFKDLSWKLQSSTDGSIYLDLYRNTESNNRSSLYSSQTMFIVRLNAPVSASEIKFTGPSNGTITMQEMYINYFEDMAHFNSTKYLRASKIAYGLPYKERAPSSQKNHTVRTGGAQFKPSEYFGIDQTGQVIVRFAMLNFEAISAYKLVVTAFTEGMSKTFRMASQGIDGLPGYVSFDHGLGVVPGIAHITIIPDTGNLRGYHFHGVGTVMGDEYYNEDYGGLLYAVSPTSIRLWAPKASQYFKKGYLVNLGPGWGGGTESYTQSHTATVTVSLKRAVVPNYDSGWRSMRSNDPSDSFMELVHNVKSIDGTTVSAEEIKQARVKVVYRTKDKSRNNAYFEFEATGAQQGDASGGRYGGIIYSYSTTKVRLWAPYYGGLTERVTGYEIRYYNNSKAVIKLDEATKATDNNFIHMVYTTKDLESRDKIICHNTYDEKRFDYEHIVSRVIDFYSFEIVPHSESVHTKHKVQVVKTSVIAINEIQTIMLRAPHASGVEAQDSNGYEIQRLQCNATDGHFALRLTGGYDPEPKFFTISAKSSTVGDLTVGLKQLSFMEVDPVTCLPIPKPVQVTIEGSENLRVCDNGDFNIKFERVPGSTVNGATGGGNVAQMTIHDNTLTNQYLTGEFSNISNTFTPFVNVSTIRDGTPQYLEGCIKIRHEKIGSDVLVPILSSASAFKNKFLEKGVSANVAVVEINPEKREYDWVIEFVEGCCDLLATDTFDGNIASLSVFKNLVAGDGANLHVCSSRDSYGLCSVDDSRDGSSITGGFALQFGNIQTVNMDYDIDASVMKEKIRAALNNINVDVTRIPNPVSAKRESYIWTITFQNSEQHLAVVNSTNLTTTIPTIFPSVEAYALYYNGGETYVQIPDANDCGLGQVPCFRFEDIPDTELQNASFVDEAQSWGKCEVGFSSIGQTCSAYPLRTSLEEGKAMNVPVGRGWEGPIETAAYEDEVEVRVTITLAPDLPVRATGSQSLGRGSRRSYHHDLDYIPARVKVVAKVGSGSTICDERSNCGSRTWNGFYFDGVGSAQATDFRRYKKYAGVAYAYNSNYLVFVAPGATSGKRINHADNYLFSATDGWGTGTEKTNLQRDSTEAFGYMWEYDLMAEKESVDININVIDSNEPPRMPNIYKSIVEGSANDTIVGDLTAWDQDPNGQMTYEIVGGNTAETFKVTQNGSLLVNREGQVNFESQRFYGLEIKITDGGGASVTGYVGIVITDKNDLPRFCDPHPFAQGALAKLYKKTECGGSDGKCLNPMSSTHQPLLNLLERNVSEFAKRGDEGFTGRFNNGSICTYDDDIISGEPQNMYFGISSGISGKMTSGERRLFNKEFRIGYCDGKLTVMKTGSLDFENIDAPSYYDLEIYVVDDGPQPEGIQQNASATLRIYANDGNDKPRWPANPVVVEIPEEIGPDRSVPGTRVGAPLEKVLLKMNHTLDVDVGDNHTWALKLTSPSTVFDQEDSAHPNPFNLNSKGQITAQNVRPNFEGPTQQYTLSIEVTDSEDKWGRGNTHTVSGTVIIQVTDRNDAPLLQRTQMAFPGCSINEYCRSIPENSANGTLVTGGKLVVTDEDTQQQGSEIIALIGGSAMDYFRVSSSGYISVTVEGSANLDFEAPAAQMQNLLLNITDSGVLAEPGKKAPSISIQAMINITVTDVNEDPVFQLDFMPKHVSENKVSGTYLGTLNATDPDNKNYVHQSLSYFAINPAGYTAIPTDLRTGLSCTPIYCIHSITGDVTVAEGGVINYEEPTTWNVTFQAEDDQFCESTGIIGCKTMTLVSFNVVNQNDRPTYCTDNTVCEVMFFILENNAANEHVGNPFNFFDEDVNDTLTYNIQGAPSGLFLYSGQHLRVNASNSLNYEVTNTYTLLITASDNSMVSPGPFSVVRPITVHVQDQNEAPDWMGRAQNFSCHEYNGTQVGEALRKTAASTMPSADDDTGSDKLTFTTASPFTTVFDLTIDGRIILVGGEGTGFHPCVNGLSDPVIFGVNATNKQGSSTVANVTIYPDSNANFQPSWGSASLSVSVSENAERGMELLPGAVFACDSGGSVLSYSSEFPSSTAGQMFSVVSNDTDHDCVFRTSTGKVKGKAIVRRSDVAGLNYESLATVNHKLSLFIKASDQEGVSSVTEMIIHVDDANDAPCGHGMSIGICPTLQFAVQENAPVATVVGTLTNSEWTDEDTEVDNSLNSTNASCEVMQGNSYQAFMPLFDHAPGTDVFRLFVQSPGSLNYETMRLFNLTVRISDGDLHGVGQIIVTVLDMNEPPKISSQPFLNVTEVDSLQLFNTKSVCEFGERKTVYYWHSVYQKCDLISKDLARVYVSDPDEGAAVDFQIVSVILHDHEGNATNGDASIVKLPECTGKASGEFCQIRMTSQTDRYHYFDAEQYSHIDIQIKIVEVESTCSAFPNRSPPCKRLDDIATLSFTIVDINDVVVEAITLNAKSLLRLANTAGGDTLTVHGHNFGRKGVLSDSVEVVYSPLNAETQYIASDVVRREDNSFLTCKTVAGIGQNHVVQVRVIRTGHTSVQIPLSSTQVSFSYHPPSIQSVSVPNSEANTNGSSFMTIRGTHFGPEGSWKPSTSPVVGAYVGLASFERVANGVEKYTIKGKADGHTRDRCSFRQSALHFEDASKIYIRQVGSLKVYDVPLVRETTLDVCYEESRWVRVGCWRFPNALANPTNLGTTSNGILKYNTKDHLVKCALAARNAASKPAYFVASDEDALCYFNKSAESTMFDAVQQNECDGTQQAYPLYHFPEPVDDQFISQYVKVRQTYITVPNGSPLEAMLNAVDSAESEWEMFLFTATTSVVFFNNFVTKHSPAATTGLYPVLSGSQFTFSGCMVSVDELICPVPPGVGRNFQVTMMVGGQTSNSVSFLGYRAPSVRGVVLPPEFDMLPTRSNVFLTILGSDFGQDSDMWTSQFSSGSVTYQEPGSRIYEAANCNLDASDGSKIKCESRPGLGKHFRWKVAVGGVGGTRCGDGNGLGSAPTCGGMCIQWGSCCVAPAFFDIDRSDFSLCSSMVTPASSSLSVQTYGDLFFGLRFHYLGCWSNPSTVSSADRKVDLMSSVSSSQCAGLGTNMLNDCAQYAHLASWSAFSIGFCQCNSLGYLLCTCGLVQVSGYPSYGPNTRCSSNGLSYSDASLSIYKMDGLQRVESAWLNSNISYAPPRLGRLEGVDQSPTKGGNTFVVHGENFGPNDSGEYITLEYGNPNPLTKPRPLPFTARDCILVDDTQLRCKMAPGTGKGHSWLLSMGSQSTGVLPMMTYYNPPVVKDFLVYAIGDPATVEQFNTSGGQMVEIEGTDFGPKPNETSYLYNLSVSTEWTLGPAENDRLTKFVPRLGDCVHSVPHERIRCLVPAGVGRKIKWDISVDGQQSVQPTTAYGKPRIFSVEPNVSVSEGLRATNNGVGEAHPAGGETVRIRGENFGSKIEYLGGVWYGCNGLRSYKMTDCKLESRHVTITCKTAAGVGSNLQFSIEVGGQMHDFSSAGTGPLISYKVPRIYHLRRNGDFDNPNMGGTTYGRYSFQIEGQYFGTLGGSASPVSLQNSYALFDNGEYIMLKPKDVLVSKYGKEVVVIEIPEGQGLRVGLVLKHVPPGAQITGTTCTHESDPLYYAYKNPLISRIKAAPKRNQSSNDAFPVTLSVYGENVLDDGTFPNPDGVWDNGGSFGARAEVTTGSLLSYNRVSVYRYLNQLQHAANLSVEALNGAHVCTPYSYGHNRAICDINFDIGKEIVGASIVWVGWQTSPASPHVHDGGNWWIYENGAWIEVGTAEYFYIEGEFRAGEGKCTTECICTYGGDLQEFIIPNNISNKVVSFTLSYRQYTARLSSGANTVMTRLCGQPSNPQIFSDVQPEIYDICVFGGNWARKGTPCGAHADENLGEQTDILDGVTTVSFQPATFLRTDGGNGVSSINDADAAERFVFIYGNNFVGKEEVLVEFLSPLGEQTKLSCDIRATFFKASDDMENCLDGCTLLCKAPKGYGKNWRVRVKRGGLTNAEMRHFLSYHPPTISSVVSSDGTLEALPTSGAQLTITGKNFGINPKVMVGHVTPFFNSDGLCQCAHANISLVCDDSFLTSNLAHTSLSSKSCYLKELSRTLTHTGIVVELPPGVGRNHDFMVVSYNQFDASLKLSFSPPSVTLVSHDTLGTRGGEEVVLTGKNFGAFMGTSADIFSAVSNKTSSNLRMSFGGELAALIGIECNIDERSGPCENPGICISYWDHTRISFYSPEGDGAYVQLDIIVGNQVSAYPSSSPNGNPRILKYARPEVFSVDPSENILSSGRISTEIHMVERLDSDSTQAGLVHHVPFHNGDVSVGNTVLIINNRAFNVPVVRVDVVECINSTAFKFVVSLADTNAVKVAIQLGFFGGGYIEGPRVKITLRGKNFGIRLLNITVGDYNAVHPGRNAHVCHSLETFSPSENVLFRNHTMLVFNALEGEGLKLPLGVRLSGNSIVKLDALSYKAPTILRMAQTHGPTDGCNPEGWETKREWDERVGQIFTDAERQQQVPGSGRLCKQPAEVQFIGLSLGSAKLEGWVGSFPLCTDPIGCHTTGHTPYLGGADRAKQHKLPRQDHNIVTMASPVGYGGNLSAFLLVDHQRSNNITYSFNSPVIEEVNPNPFDARGAAASVSNKLEITGFELGGVASPVEVHLNAAKCLKSVWKREHPQTGFPYIECFPPKMVAGIKTARLNIAGQSAEERADAYQPKFVAVCKAGGTDLRTGKTARFYGGHGELCVACPNPGAICGDSTFDNPVSQYGFWRENLDITCTDISEDGFKCNAYQNEKHIARAKASERGVKGGCPRERYDLALKKDFEDLVIHDKCFTFAGCMPEVACKGRNDCAIGYEYQRKKCKAWEATPVRGQPNSGKGVGQYACLTDSDCRTRSGNKNRPLGIQCGFYSPEDCSICVKDRNQNGTVVGHCECSPPTRCSLCTHLEYFRMDDECQPCPDQPWLIFILFGLAIVGAIVGSYVLNSYNFNMAFISIGVDYFQVLALFSNAKIKWPKMLKDLLKVFSIFNFNIDVTAPECIVPEFEYDMKWYAIMLLPLACMGFVIIVWFIIGLRNIVFFWRQGLKAMCKHSSMLIATMITLMYYMYLMLVRRIFDVYNCKENDVAPDGRLYAPFTSVRCDGGVCACWEWDDPNSMQIQLWYWTIPAIIFYMIGFPLFLLIVLRCNKKAIKEDQILRAYDLGSVESENMFAFNTRQKYHRIYYHFKPGKTYWMVVIVLRKFFIALIGVVFAGNAGFQLSITMLLLFICYLLQEKHKPYMSSMERDKVALEHVAKVKEGHPLHMTIHEHIKSAKLNKKKRMNVTATRKIRKDQTSRKGGVSLDSTLAHARNYRRLKKTNYFFDYNTVESVLLACAILVCLAGTMIESGKFTYADGTDVPSKVWHRDLIGFFVTLVVFLSIIYYVSVFASELGVELPKGLASCFATKKKATERLGSDAATLRSDGDEQGHIELSINPIHSNKKHAAEASKLRQERQIEQQQNAALAGELKGQLASLQQLKKGQREHQAFQVGKRQEKKRNVRKKAPRKEFNSLTRPSTEPDDAETLLGSDSTAGRDEESWAVNPLLLAKKEGGNI